MVKNYYNPKNQPFLFIIHPNVLENAINQIQVLSPLPTTVQCWDFHDYQRQITGYYKKPYRQLTCHFNKKIVHRCD